MPITESQKKYEKKRALQCKTYAIKYTPSEMNISDALQKYLSDNGLTANKYIKELIMFDLIRKGYL